MAQAPPWSHFFWGLSVKLLYASLPVSQYSNGARQLELVMQNATNPQNGKKLVKPSMDPIIFLSLFCKKLPTYGPTLKLYNY